MASTALILSFSSSYSEQIMVKTPAGEKISLEIASDESFVDVMKRLESEMEVHDVNCESCTSSFVIDFHTTAAVKPGSRDYFAKISSDEKEDLKYIVTTLATASWTSLLSKKSSLKKAGDRIDHLHPLRFLSTIFNDEEMNGCFHVIQDRSAVWSEFYGDFSKNLESESNAGNMTDKMIHDFAKIVKVDAKLISKPIKVHNWSGFIKVLLEEIPRAGDPDRYDN